MKEPEVNEKIKDDMHKCDLIVSVKAASPKEKTGGLAFEVILQPAVVAVPPQIVRDLTPQKRQSLPNMEEIERKLKEANERRLSIEASKLQMVAKHAERVAETGQRIQGLNESFSRDAEKKLVERMEANADKKNAQIKALHERLQEHAKHVEEVRKIGEQYRVELRERIERKMDAAGSKRDEQLSQIQERIRKHKQHVDEVLEQSSKFSKDTEEKIIHKMEASMKNREKQISGILDRLKDHERRVQTVRQNKNNSLCDDSSSVKDDTSDKFEINGDGNYENYDTISTDSSSDPNGDVCLDSSPIANLCSFSGSNGVDCHDASSAVDDLESQVGEDMATECNTNASKSIKPSESSSVDNHSDQAITNIPSERGENSGSVLNGVGKSAEMDAGAGDATACSGNVNNMEAC